MIFKAELFDAETYDVPEFVANILATLPTDKDFPCIKGDDGKAYGFRRAGEEWVLIAICG